MTRRTVAAAAAMVVVVALTPTACRPDRPPRPPVPKPPPHELLSSMAPDRVDGEASGPHQVAEVAAGAQESSPTTSSTTWVA